MNGSSNTAVTLFVLALVGSAPQNAKAGWFDDARNAVCRVGEGAVELGGDAAGAVGDAARTVLPYVSPLNVMAAVPYVESAVTTAAGAAADAADAVGDAAVVVAGATAGAAVVVAETAAPVVVPAARAVADVAVAGAETVADGGVALAGVAVDGAEAVVEAAAPVVVPVARAVAETVVAGAEAVANVAVTAADVAVEGAGVVAGTVAEAGRAAANLAGPVVVPVAHAARDAAAATGEFAADTAGLLGGALEPTVAPLVQAVGDFVGWTGDGVAAATSSAAATVAETAGDVAEAVVDGLGEVGRRLRDPLAELGTAILNAHPEATRRGTLRFVELVGAGVEATADVAMRIGVWTYENRKLVLSLGIVGTCLYVTGGAGSLWCVALGAGVRGAESVASQLLGDGGMNMNLALLDTADGALAGLAGGAGPAILGRAANWLRLFGLAAGLEVGSELIENAVARRPTEFWDVAQRLGRAAAFTVLVKVGQVAWSFARGLVINLRAGASLSRAAALSAEGTEGATGFLGSVRLRRRAIDRAWRNESNTVQQGSCGLSRCWTLEEQAQLAAAGHVSGYDGHHLTSVVADPLMAGNPCNIGFLGRADHLAAHGGAFQNPTWGEMLFGCVP
ncbi:MAG: hypothetical protein HY905_16910 [Deltaproteobacteria bacterium]|nr:hypothetical protein [Deltaproteobacteria bacterium]